MTTVDVLLARQAEALPDACFLRFAGESLTFGEVHRRSSTVARGLAALGVRRGDIVPVMMANRSEFVIAWFALCELGAVATLVNTQTRGAALAHALRVGGGEVAIIDESLLPAMFDVRAEVPQVQRLIVPSPVTPATGMSGDVLGVIDLSSVVQLGRTAAPPSSLTRSPLETAMVMFTSGTTGPSKGCMLSHRYAIRQAELIVEHLRLRPDDVLYCPFPLFHLDALVLTVMPALVLGATAAIGSRFSVSGFWDEVRAFDATVFDFMGATLTLLHKAPARADDQDNNVRLAWGVPVPAFAGEFEARFGLQLVELYGSTDAGVPVYQPLDAPRRAGSCGRAISEYDVRLFDELDQPVPQGDVGEIVVRPREPGLMSAGYYGMPEATVAVNRNLWFHTGDFARQDGDGYFYFVGRRADSIRRRGENISAFEIEEVVKLHPAVLDAAAYGVPSELTEDDVMVAVVRRSGHTLAPAELAQFCRERMARHMVPRYIDFVDALPRTSTEKVAKAALTERGVTTTTWDRESDATHRASRP